MKTLLGNEIPETIKGIVYLCNFDHDKLALAPYAEIMCEQANMALHLYAEIPNPASQLAMGGTHQEFCKELK